jgi:hypothetical protein
MSVIEPAPVSIPQYIKNIGIVNRSLPSEENSQINKIDQILSVEGADLDIEGAAESIRGVQDELMKNNRFTNIKYLKNVNERGSGLAVFPAPLDWGKVEKICHENKVDALFILEVFDTDTKISYTSNPVTVQGPFGVSMPALEHQADMTTLVNAGWRIYDPQSRELLDQYSVLESVSSSGKGINPAAAAAALMGRKEAVKQCSYTGGQSYAYRILPYSIRVRREYYVRGTDNFKIAKRRAQTGNWDGAAELWEKETNNSKRKVAGRAHYNMAIINEINGNLQLALEWAQKAYTDYRIKLALDYVRILEGRIVREEQLRQQMEE